MSQTQDPIMARYTDLSLAHEIPDMQEYAKNWQRLALECDKEGRIATAETCRKNAQHYYELEGGEYIRLIEDCFAELIKTESPEVTNGVNTSDE